MEGVDARREPPMRLTVVGCSGSFPGPESAASCYLVEADGFRMLLDLGNGAARRAAAPRPDPLTSTRSWSATCTPTTASTCCALYVARTYDPTARSTARSRSTGPLVAARASRPGLRHAPTSRGAGRGVRRSSSGRAGSHRVGPFTVTVARMAHPVETWGMRVEHDGRGPGLLRRHRAVRRRSSSWRATPTSRCSSRPSRRTATTHAPKDLHLTGGEAGEAASLAGARRLVLTHLPPWNDPAVSRRAAEAAFGGAVELAEPGATYDV